MNAGDLNQSLKVIRRFQLELVPGCGLVTDLDGLILDANEAVIDLLDTTREELLGQTLATFVAEDSRQTLQNQIAQIGKKDVASEIEICLKTAQGKLFDCALRYGTASNNEQSSAFVLWLLRELSSEQRLAKLLQQENMRLSEELERQSHQVQKILDFESMLKRITDKVRDSLDESQILQTAVKELTVVLDLAGCNAALYDLDEGTSTIRYEYTASMPAYQGRVAQMDHFPEIYSQLHHGYYFQFCSLVPNPMRGRVAMLACPIFVDPHSSKGIDQAVLGDLWLINHQDHEFSESEIRLVQQVANQCAIAIRQARLYQAAQVQVQELEKLNRLKDEFLSTVSHELRTPIANVKMATHMLKLASTDDRRKVYLDILEAETLREAELIDELLDLQRLEAISLPICIDIADVQEWLPTVIEPFQGRFANRQQILQISYADHLLPLASDLGILQRILAELLNNACKYTAEGGEIFLQVHTERATSQAEERSATVFTICNQAEIPVEDLPYIFEKFYRVIQADRYKQGGTGLGLALVQKRAEQLGGTVKAESKANWTTFTVTIPNQLQA